MPHTIKVGKTELTISTRRYIRFADRLANWSPERRTLAHEAAEARLKGKHPRKRDAAIYAVTASNGLGSRGG